MLVNTERRYYERTDRIDNMRTIPPSRCSVWDSDERELHGESFRR